MQNEMFVQNKSREHFLAEMLNTAKTLLKRSEEKYVMHAAHIHTM